MQANKVMAEDDIPKFPLPEWSTSKQSVYDSCPRQYYFGRYLMWQGWPKGSFHHEEARRIAYFWQKRDTIPLWTGKLVHDAVATFLLGGKSSCRKRQRAGRRGLLLRGWETSAGPN